MEAARKKRLKFEAFCRYHFGLSKEEVKTIKPSEIKALEAVLIEDKKQYFEFFEKLIARVILLGHVINAPKGGLRRTHVNDWMYYGNSPRPTLDLTTREGQDLLCKQLLGLSKNRKANKDGK